MEDLLLGITVAICATFIVLHMCRSLGIGTKSGNPDCGCGTCAEKGAAHD